jgi:hypothetical protein
MIDLLGCNHASGYRALKHSAFVAAAGPPQKSLLVFEMDNTSKGTLHKVSLYFDIVRAPIPDSRIEGFVVCISPPWHMEGSCSEDPLVIDVC